MNLSFKIVAAAVCGLLLGLPAAQADDYWPVTNVFIQLGTAENDLTIHPREVTLQAGAHYRFVVINPSESTHIVAAPELRLRVLTTELVYWTPTLGYPALVLPAGISLHPGEMMVWTFIPFEKGIYKFGCDDPIHAAAGMHTTITVVDEVL